MTAVAFSPLLLHLLVVLHFVQLVSSTDHEPPHEEVGEHLTLLKGTHNAQFEILPQNVTNVVAHSRLQKQLEDIFRTSRKLIGTKDSFPMTGNIITDDIYLFGEHVSGPNISDSVCGRFLARSMHGEECNKRVVRFKPGKPISMPVHSIKLSLPKLWIREQTKEPKPNITVFLCWEGHKILHLEQYTIVPEKELVLNDQYYEHNFRWFSAHDVLSEVAIVVDHKWNNVNMKLHGGMGILFMQKDIELRRKIFTDVCNVGLGRKQECCRWPHRVRIPPSGKQIVFHSCLGQVPKEVFRFPFLSEDLQKLLEKGLMSRRFVTSVDKTCRERTHSVRPVSSIVSNGLTLSYIHAMDAKECVLSY